MKDRDGTWIDEIPDGNDHSIDAVRYAMMEDVLREQLAFWMRQSDNGSTPILKTPYRARLSVANMY